MVPHESYFKATILTGFSYLKAPFLKVKIALPLLTVPSGKNVSYGKVDPSSSIALILSSISCNYCYYSSPFKPRTTK
jgi:predicted ATPase